MIKISQELYADWDYAMWINSEKDFCQNFINDIQC